MNFSWVLLAEVIEAFFIAISNGFFLQLFVFFRIFIQPFFYFVRFCFELVFIEVLRSPSMLIRACALLSFAVVMNVKLL